MGCPDRQTGRVQVNIRLDQEMYDALTDAAWEAGMTVSGYVKHLIGIHVSGKG